MKKTSFFSEIARRWFILLIACACLTLSAVSNSVFGQATTEQAVVVTAQGPVLGPAQEVPSAYGAPPAFSRSRFSDTVNAYVLPPWAFFFGELFEGRDSATDLPIIFSPKK